MVRVIRNNHKISQCQKCPGIRLNWELRSIWISILPLVFLGLFKSLLVNVVGSMVRGIHFWFSFFQISMHYLLCAKLLRNFKYSSTSRPFCWRCTLGRVKKAKMLEYFYWKVVLAFWFGHPKCHFRYLPLRQKWVILGVFGYFGGTENGTWVARIKILRPLFNTNTPPKTPI